MKLNINKNWTIKKAKELYTYSSGISKGSQYFGTGYPYLTFTEIFHNYFVPKQLTSLVQSTEKERTICSIKRGDVFLTRTSETDNELGMSCVALSDYPNATFNGFSKRLRPYTDDIIPEYAGYYFRSPVFRAAVSSMASIITRASLNEKMLDKLPVIYPNKKTQQKIASILSTYDNLIQNYKKQIEDLQTCASELYKEWFVRFRFPGCKTTQFENGIPAEWKIIRLSNFCRITDGTHDTPAQVEDGIPLVTGKAVKNGEIDFSIPYNISVEDHEKIKKRSGLKTGDILFSNIGTVGNTCLVNYDREFSVKNMIIFKPETETQSMYLFHLLNSDSMQSLFAAQTNGSTQQFLGLDFMRKFKILLPSNNIIKSFGEKELIIQHRITNLRKQITNLTQQRDLLLPRLMSGKLEV